MAQSTSLPYSGPCKEAVLLPGAVFKWLQAIIIFVLLLMLATGILAGRPGPTDRFFIEIVHPWNTISIGLFVLMLIYFFLSLNFGPKVTAESAAQKMGFGTTILRISYFFLPFISLDVFPGALLPLRFFPLLYCAYAIYLIVFISRVRRKITTTLHTVVLPPDFFTKYGISPRDKEVLGLILQGKTNPRIAAELFISLPTVKTHIQRIFQKTGVDSRYALINFLSSDSHHDTL